MPISSNPLRRRRISQFVGAGVLSLGAFTLVTFYVWTAPLGWMWHLLNGRFTTFEGQKIHVPWDFWVNRLDSGDIVITRPTAEYSLLHSPAGNMFIRRPRHGVQLDLSKDYDRVASRLVSSQESDGYELRTVRKLFIRNELGYCWEFMRSDSRALSVFCWFDKDTLAVEFVGSPEYREKFYSVLGDLSDAPPKSEK